MGLVEKKNDDSRYIISCGDCEEVLQQQPDESVDLILTSPPYADNRKKLYGGPKPDEYVDWFMPKAKQLHRVLKSKGTFILNIKEKVVRGERHTYVLDLILEMRKRGWLWTEEFVWHKRNCVPGKWPNRFRDAWERCLQFNKERKFNMYQDEVMIPMGDWAESRMAHLGEGDKVRHTAAVGSGFGRKVANWKDRDKAYPSNVLHLATECGNKGHGAVFPMGLPEWFIKLFTQIDDLVLDPFAGSGTTGVAAKKLARSYLGIDLMKENQVLSQKRLKEVQRCDGINLLLEYLSE